MDLTRVEFLAQATIEEADYAGECALAEAYGEQWTLFPVSVFGQAP